MAHMLTPNEVQALHPHHQRVPLGTPGFVPHPDPIVIGKPANYWFFIPTLFAGDLIITLPNTFKADVVVRMDKQEIHHNPSTNLVVIPRKMSSDGFYFISVTPPLPVKVEYQVHGWPKELKGEPLIPWNFYWYPYAPGAYKSGKFDATATQLSAMKKYDQAFRTVGVDSALAWEKAHHNNPDAETWEGHCPMSAVASVYFKQPLPTKIVNGVTFLRDEMELIAAEWAGHNMPDSGVKFTIGASAHARLDGAPVIMFIHPPGTEFFPKDGETEEDVKKRKKALLETYLKAVDTSDDSDPDTRRARAEADLDNVNFSRIRQDFAEAGRLLIDFFINEVVLGGHPVYGDFGPSSEKSPAGEVWTNALFSGHLDFAELPPPNQDPRFCSATLTLHTNIDRAPDVTPHLEPATVKVTKHAGTPLLEPEPQGGVADSREAYVYELWVAFKDNGTIDQVLWAGAHSYAADKKGRVSRQSTFAPRLLTTIPRFKPVSGPGNPKIDDRVLSSGLLELRSRYAKPGPP